MLHKVNDPAFRGKIRKVFLDGKNISDICFACDDEAGWADVFVKDPQTGKHVRNPDGSTKTKTLVGQVRVEVQVIVRHEPRTNEEGFDVYVSLPPEVP